MSDDSEINIKEKPYDIFDEKIEEHTIDKLQVSPVSESDEAFLNEAMQCYFTVLIKQAFVQISDNAKIKIEKYVKDKNIKAKANEYVNQKLVNFQNMLIENFETHPSFNSPDYSMCCKVQCAEELLNLATCTVFVDIKRSVNSMIYKRVQKSIDSLVNSMIEKYSTQTL